MTLNLWWATKKPDTCRENELRALRLWQFLEESNPPITYKDIRRELGLSYRQTVRAVGLLCASGVAHVSVTADWNGQHYIYPHRVWLVIPPCQ